MKYEVRISNVPDGCWDEDYLGDVRECETLKEARSKAVAFRLARSMNPENFETGMTAKIIRLSDGAILENR
jgi:hypothetical protein